jgi:hypothetical protein
MTPMREADGRVHFSSVKAMSLSAAHYKWRIEHPKEETAAIRIGAATDDLVLGAGRRVRIFDGVRNGKKWEAFKEENAGGLLLNLTESETASTSAEAVLSDPISRAILDEPGAQKQMVAQWEAYGLPFAAGIEGVRGGFDVVGSEFVTDLKATNSSDPYRLERQILNQLWYAQLVLYCDACKKLGMGRKKPRLICVEAKKDGPPVVTVVRLGPRFVEMGHKSLTLWAEKLRACEAANAWPGYAQAEVDVDAPDMDLATHQTPDPDWMEES